MADAIETHSRALALLQTTTIATLDDMLSPEDIAAPLRYARASQSANTRAAYDADWTAFVRCVPVPRLCQRDAHLGQAPPVQGTRRRLAEIRWQHVHWSRGMPVYHHGGDRTGVDNSQSDKPTATLAPLARAVCRREGRRRSLLGALIRSGTSRLCQLAQEGITHLSPPCAEAEG